MMIIDYFEIDELADSFRSTIIYFKIWRNSTPQTKLLAPLVRSAQFFVTENLFFITQKFGAVHSPQQSICAQVGSCIFFG